MKILRQVFLRLFLFLVFFSGTLLLASDEGKIPITTKSEKAKELFIQARDLGEKLRVQEAVDVLNSVISEDPDFAQAYLLRAQGQTSGKDFTADLNKAVSLAGQVSEPEQLLIRGFEAGVNGNLSEQKEMYEKLVSLLPNDERVHFTISNYYAGVQNYDKAIEELNKSIQINPQFTPAYNSLGYAYKNSDKLDEAEQTFQKYTQVLPGDPNPYDSYAELLLKRGKWNEAIDNYKKALNLNPDFNSSKIGIATAHLYQGNYDEARNQIQDLLNSAKNNGTRQTALNLMAISYIDEGKLDDAVTQLDKEYNVAQSYMDYPGMSNVQFRKGVILYEMGKYDQANEQFQSSLDNFDKSDATQEAKENYKTLLTYNSALVSLKQQDLTQAAAKSKDFMSVSSKNENQAKIAHQLNAMMLLEQKDPEGAINELKSSNQRDPYNFYLLGKAHQLKGDNQNAKMYFEKVLSFNELPTQNFAIARYNSKKSLGELK